MVFLAVPSNQLKWFPILGFAMGKLIVRKTWTKIPQSVLLFINTATQENTYARKQKRTKYLQKYMKIRVSIFRTRFVTWSCVCARRNVTGRRCSHVLSSWRRKPRRTAFYSKPTHSDQNQGRSRRKRRRPRPRSRQGHDLLPHDAHLLWGRKTNTSG